MPLSRAIFYSRPTGTENADTFESDVDAVAVDLRKAHSDEDVTGCMIFTGEWYLQLIEGRRKPLSDFIGRTFLDARFSDTRMIEFSGIDYRSFAHWSFITIGANQFFENLISEQLMAEDQLQPVFKPTEISSIIRFLALHHRSDVLLGIE
ncbi:MAG: BLUF domain-containing protein [Pseudomonadota bacterium]